MSLKAEPEMAGKVVRCPGCNAKLQIPEMAGVSKSGPLPLPDAAPPPDAADAGLARYEVHKPERLGWKETDPSNPNGVISFCIGLVVTLTWFGMVYPFIAPDGTDPTKFTTGQWLANLFFKHFTVSFANTLFFCWAMATLYLKLQKLRHQREALFLDVLPAELGREINGENVSTFIDHVYNLPHRLRDSLMVNRIRKALELFEARQSTGDVTHMLTSQSAIDGARIFGSYIMVRAFLWAIPLLGFIGTVIGLSHALGSMSFAGMEDVSKVISSLGGVTSGLGTAFDATLLGLVLAVTLNFPMNAMAKHEEEVLNEIDTFCIEVLLPRLNDGSGAGGGNMGAIADSVIKGLASAQKEFLTDLNELSKRMNDYATNLDRRTDAFQSAVTKEFITNMTAMRTEVEGALRDSMKLTSQYIGALETGVRGLNTVLKELGEKQIVIQQVTKKGWFSR
ncbi:MAG: MotA/TolQ/ExbB proton channel family protein [Roseimicrobium sp.]